jgi:predicted Zn-dependent peptidase
MTPAALGQPAGPRFPSPPAQVQIVKSGSLSDRHVTKTVLPNGLRVITEEMPQVRSVAVGAWVDVGSRHEQPEEGGISHFIEHMVFKGTEHRSAEDIACSVDAIGGHLDAFTMKETVAFTAKVLDEHLPRAVDVLSDLVLHPVFREEDIVKEKGVILEELKMDEDNPDYLIHEMFSHTFWKGHPLGMPIIGNAKTISAFQRDQLLAFFRQAYRPSDLIVTAAGNVAHGDIVKLVEDRFGFLEAGRYPKTDVKPTARAEIVQRDKQSLEQTHLCLGVETFPISDERRFAGYVLNTLLGGGVSSRLFLKIREQEGLAYAVFSDLSLYSDTGCLSVYAGTSPHTVSRVIDHVMNEFRGLKETLVPEDELTRAKDHLKGSLMLSLESTSSRMSNLARQEQYFGRFPSLDEVSAKIDAVTAEELQLIARECLQQERITVAVLGKLNGFRVEREHLAC